MDGVKHTASYSHSEAHQFQSRSGRGGQGGHGPTSQAYFRKSGGAKIEKIVKTPLKGGVFSHNFMSGHGGRSQVLQLQRHLVVETMCYTGSTVFTQLSASTPMTSPSNKRPLFREGGAYQN